jgi:hypothetical protein
MTTKKSNKPDDWGPISREQCPVELDRRNEIRFQKMEKRLMAHIDHKLDPLMKGMKGQINLRTTVYALALVMFIGFAVIFALL